MGYIGVIGYNERIIMTARHVLAQTSMEPLGQMRYMFVCGTAMGE